MHTTDLLKKSFSIIALVFLVLVLLPSGSIRAASLANPLADAIAVSITPSTSANNASTPVMILGSGFTADSTASLGCTRFDHHLCEPNPTGCQCALGPDPGGL